MPPPPQHLATVPPAANMNRATRYQNAMHQIQERNKNTQSQAVDVPANTLERHAKSVRPFVAYLCLVPQRSYLCPFFLAQVPQPIATLPTEEQFWMNDQHGRRKPNAEFLRHHFIHEGRLTEDQAVAILRLSKDLLASEPNMLKVRSPVTGM
jgi:hypothetical protein